MNHDAAAIVRRRKRKAILAGGTVLGLGAAVTLAAWTDDVWVTGAFSAGTFNVQGNVTESAATGWEEYITSGDSGPLAFTVAAANLTPGTSVYAPLNLRIGPEPSEYDAAVSLPTAPVGPADTTPGNNIALFDTLQLSLYDVPPADCNDVGTGGLPLTGFENTSLTATSTGTLLTLDGDMTPRGLCFKVTLPEDAPSAVQGGQTGDLTWNFHAESVDPTP